MKQGDPQYEIVCNFEGKFRLYGRVVKSDKKKGFWQIEYDLLSLDANILVLNWDVRHLLPRGSEEPEYNHAKEDVNDFVNVFCDMLEYNPDSDCKLALPVNANMESYAGEDKFEEGEEDAKQKSNQ